MKLLKEFLRPFVVTDVDTRDVKPVSHAFFRRPECTIVPDRFESCLQAFRIDVRKKNDRLPFLYFAVSISSKVGRIVFLQDGSSIKHQVLVRLWYVFRSM